MRILQISLAFVFSFLIASSVQAGDAIYTGWFSDTAVDGYDTVAFFTDNKPIKGKPEFKTDYQGAEWLFASQEHLDLFKADPEKYAPQYGGFCAWAVAAKNDRAPGYPKFWTIVDGKLYLNYSESVQRDWLGDKEHFIQQANKNWPALLAK